MTIDREKLKALAETLLRDERGEEFTEEEAAAFPQAVRDFESITAPSAIMALLAEIEENAMHMRAFGEVMRSQAEQIGKLKAENEALRSLVLSALEEGKGRPGTGGNAPGHCHAVPGVWDRGNGERSGAACGWCRIWNAAQAMAKEAIHD